MKLLMDQCRSYMMKQENRLHTRKSHTGFGNENKKEVNIMSKLYNKHMITTQDWEKDWLDEVLSLDKRYRKTSL